MVIVRGLKVKEIDLRDRRCQVATFLSLCATSRPGMARIITEDQIARLLNDAKPLTFKQLNKLKNPQQQINQNLVSELSVVGKSKRKYRLHCRSQIRGRSPNNFCVRLTTTFNSNDINIIRCDGFQIPHTNHIEHNAGNGIGKIPKHTCHIHRLTQNRSTGSLRRTN